MRKFFVLFIGVMFVLIKNSFAQIRSSNDLLGIWSGNQIRVEFIDNSRVSVLLPGGRKQVGNYTGDFFHTPVVLEMSFNDGSGKVEFKCMVELTQTNLLKWQLFDKTDVPKNFTKSSYTLTRVKN